jgi:hypothetical protein
MTTEDGECPCDSDMYVTGDCPIHDTHGCDECDEPATYYHEEEHHVLGDVYSCEKHKCEECIAL